MSMLSRQIDELRLMGDGQAAKGEFTVATLLREAADTIESMRDRLQVLQGVTGESRYSELFGTPERAARSMASGFSTPDGIYGDYDALLEWLRGDAK